MTRKDFSKDISVLRENKEKLFKRRPTNNRYFKKVLLGERNPYYFSEEVIKNIDYISIEENFESEDFYELIANKIQQSDYTLTKLAEEIVMNKDDLCDLLDGEKLPWSYSVKSIYKLCVILDIPVNKVGDLFKSLAINERDVMESATIQYAARSKTGISSSTLKDSIYDANLKIAIDREKEKRDKFIKELLEKPIE